MSYPSLWVTGHPSKDISPAISPNGKSLAFVSYREDPEGDVYVVSINPKKLLGKTRKSIEGTETLDEDAENITQYQDPKSKTILIIKDADPCWSPDGRKIVFSSRRKEDIENLWIMNKNGKDKKKLTTKGGIHPRFSPDGKEIIFISYRDEGSKGDVYILNLETKEERRVTRPGKIRLYPSFNGSGTKIIFPSLTVIQTAMAL